MELLFHGRRSKGDVLRCNWGDEDPERIEGDFRPDEVSDSKASAKL
jgi:hypothetical protein